MVKIIKIEIAKHSGFCFGVKRAMNMASESIDKEKTKVYSIGSIIHNEQAMEKLIKKGLIVEENLSKIEENTSTLIRSHGLPMYFYDIMKEKNINIVDATCPFVKKIQDIVFEKSKKGYEIIIIGDSNHPEVIGINGWSLSNSTIIIDEKEASEFIGEKDKKYIVVVQTTFNIQKLDKIKEILLNKQIDIEFNDTICYATHQRQKAAQDLSKKVDLMIVVGGTKSSNTKKLAEICQKNCETILIETAKELNEDYFVGKNYVGIVAGASTPDFVVDEIYDYVNKINIKELEFND